MKKQYVDHLKSNPPIKQATTAFLGHESIKKNIRIVNELKELIPALQPEEYRQLEENILQHGCRDALLIWETTEGVLSGADDSSLVYVLVDGHNRHGICERHGLDFRINQAAFNNLDEVRSFMIDNQLGRRNLTPEQMSYLRGKRYTSAKKTTGKPERDELRVQNAHVSLTDSLSGQSSYASDGYERTSDRLAAQFKVNRSTIQRDAKFSEGADKLAPELRAQVLARQVKVPKTLIQSLASVDAPTGSLTLADLPVQDDEPTPPVEGAASLAPKLVEGAQPHLTLSKKQLQLSKKIRSLLDSLNQQPEAATELSAEILATARQLASSSKKLAY